MRGRTTAAPDLTGGTDQASINAILGIVRRRTGVDFTRYRPATVRRRILNRMLSVGLSDFEAYLGRLETVSEEPERLVERITIKVSRFYRHAPTFDRLRADVIPRLVEARAGAPLRVWSVGCGCGEEVYTLAMLLCEAGAEGVVEGSDIDPHALEQAHCGIYPVAAASELPPELIERHLQPARIGRDAGLRVADHLRRRVRFSRFDLTSQAPAKGRFDLICCRNVLIYLQREMQEQVLLFLHTSLAKGGFLCLGEAEWPPPSIAALLAPLSHKTRLFRATEP